MKYIKYPIFLLLVIASASCKKSFLDKRPLDSMVSSNYYQTEEQLLKGTAPLYNIVWQGYNFKGLYEIEHRTNVIMSNNNVFKNFRVTSGDGRALESWQSFYNVIGQANLVIDNIKKYAPKTVSEAAKKNAIAEAKYIRGLSYAFLVSLWGEVPVLESNETLLTDTSLTKATIPSIWDFIIKDLRYAAENLYPSSPQAGRLNKYAGEAMLARFYLTRAGVGSVNGQRRQTDLDSAAWLCRDVINNGPFKMLDSYEELFKSKNDNNTESIFALQWVFGGNWGTQNATQAFIAFNSSITGAGDGWGGAFGAGLAQLKLYEDFVKDKRRKATYMFPGDRYSYITQEIDSASKKWKRPLIVPYNPNTNSYNAADAGVYQLAWIKKYVVGRPEDNDGQVANMSTGINTYMMRLPEVYLTLAEAVLGNATTTTNAEVVNAVNKVRTRAGLNPKTEITWDDIYKERMIEFAFEGFSNLDFSRLLYYNPTKCFQMLSDMNRGFYTLKPIPDIYNATSWELKESDQSNDQDFVTVNQSNYYLPIPELELAQAPWLNRPSKPFVPQAD